MVNGHSDSRLLSVEKLPILLFREQIHVVSWRKLVDYILSKLSDAVWSPMKL